MTTYKVVIVGNANTGKTSLLNRYVNDNFTDRLPSTIGVEFTHKELGDETNLSIWDTAGQERFQSITSTLYRGADAVLFVYDVTNIESFFGIERWYRDYLAFGDANTVKVLVGNKTDLKSTVRREEAMAWAAQKGMCYETVSAKDNHQVHKTFSTVVKLLNRLPRVQKEKIKLQQRPKTDRCCY